MTQIGPLYQNMRNILKDHRKSALNDRWSQILEKNKLTNHDVLGKTVRNKNWIMKRHPTRCGFLKYELELQLYYRATRIEYLGADVLYMGWLYVVGSRILHPDAPRWPDMELILHGQEDKLFFGESPKAVQDACKKVDLGRGYSIANMVTDRRNDCAIWDKKQIRRLEGASVLGEMFMHRVHEEPKTTAEAHAWVAKLVNSMCKPESQKILDRRENFPEGTYERSEFLKSVEQQRKPLMLPERLQHWLIADENDLHFDWFGMISTCTAIWKIILPQLEKHPIFKDHESALSWPDQTVARLLEAALVGEQVGVSVPLFDMVCDTIRKAIHGSVSKEAGNKTWIADARFAKLVDVCNPAMMLMNPGPVSFMKLYANWSDDDKISSRVGRAVWNAMQAVEASNKKERASEESGPGAENDGEPTNDDIDVEAASDGGSKKGGEGIDAGKEKEENEDDDEEEDSDAGSDSSGFSAQEITLDLNALARSGGNNIIFMGNQMSQPVSLSRSQVSRLRQAPDVSYSMGSGAPHGASRVKMLPPRATKRFSALGPLSGASEPECACGLSRYGVSVRPIPAINTKTVKVDHRCIGELFEDLDVPNPKVMSGITVKKIKIGGSRKAAKEDLS